VDRAAARGPTPWERREELGLWRGIFRTLRAVFLSPEGLFRTMNIRASMSETLAFGLLFGSIGVMFGFFWQFLLMPEKVTLFSHALFGQYTAQAVFVCILVLSPLFVILQMFVTSGIIHLLLLLVRGGKNGFPATFRVVSYGQAIHIWGLLPYIGSLIGNLWYLVVQIIGLREIHDTSYGRVIVALFIPLAALVFLFLAVLIPLFFFSFT
jgi:hypothetical protein